MRICHLIDTLTMGGAEKVAALTAAALARRGHDVTLASYHPGNAFETQTLDAGVAVKIVHGGKAGRLAGLRRMLRAGQFDVVHAYKVPVAIWARSAGRGLPRAAWFIGQHALSSDPLMVRWLGRALCGGAAGWVVPSAAAADVVARDYGVDRSRIHIVPNPVELPRLNRTLTPREARRSLDLPEAALVVSIVANLHPWKNHSLFLRAALRVKQAGRDVTFVVAGRDQMNGAVQARCRALGLESMVKFLGHTDDVARVLAATDVMTITSPQESFCLALAEAGAMGVACVSTDNGGAREVIAHEETGLIVPCDDEAALAAALLRLLDDSSLREAMGAAAARRVHARFAPDVVTNRLEQLYRAAVGEPDPLLCASRSK